MLKKRKELDKSEKVLLVQALASGEVEKKSINRSTLFAFTRKDFYEGLTLQRSDKNLIVICLDEARRAKAMNVTDIFVLSDPDNGEIISMKKHRKLSEDEISDYYKTRGNE